jgi:hypothetical protein
MNVYIADQIAREHADRLMADAALARRLRQARTSRRGSRPVEHVSTAQTHGVARTGTAAAAHFMARPFAAVHSWLLAGHL